MNKCLDYFVIWFTCLWKFLFDQRHRDGVDLNLHLIAIWHLGYWSGYPPILTLGTMDRPAGAGLWHISKDIIQY